MTKSKKRPIISSSKTNESSLEGEVAALTETIPHIVTEESIPPPPPPSITTSIATLKEKKPPAPKKTTNKKGKNGKLSNALSTTTTTTMSSSSSNHPPVAQIANIILHLKCSMQDLNSYNDELNKQLTNPLTYNPSVPPDIMAYHHHTNNYSELNQLQPVTTANANYGCGIRRTIEGCPEEYDQSTDVFAYVESNQRAAHHSLPPPTTSIDADCMTGTDHPDATDTATNGCGQRIFRRTTEEEYDLLYEGNGENARKDVKDVKDVKEMKDIHVKLKKLKISLFKNMAFMDKKSACFWCTYDFDNPECYIPRYEMDGAIHGYGSFCRPECAAAYLMKENLDDSTKFERYHLLNHIYSKIYDYKRNIKPAPNPYYMLDKYYGNLTIQEYRKLLKSDHLLLVIDKPLTRILPELHEDNEEFLTNIYGVTTTAAATHTKTSTTATMKQGVYKVRRQSDKPVGPTKSNILKEHFGIK